MSVLLFQWQGSMNKAVFSEISLPQSQWDWESRSSQNNMLLVSEKQISLSLVPVESLSSWLDLSGWLKDNAGWYLWRLLKSHSASLTISSSGGILQHLLWSQKYCIFNCSVCSTCTYPLVPYWWVFAFILSGWAVLWTVEKCLFSHCIVQHLGCEKLN